MKKRVYKLSEVIKIFGDQGISLHRRALIYMGALILAAFFLGLFLLFGAGIFYDGEEKVEQTLNDRLTTVAEKVDKEAESYAGYALNLSRQLTRSIEYTMERKERSISEFNDSQEKLHALQQAMYGDLNTTIVMGRSSGVFALVDATVNTELDNAANSKSGLYLRLVNVSSNVVLMPETILFRGDAEIAREKGLELHNRWNLEFDLTDFPQYSELMKQDGELAENMFWTDKRQLRDTWEDIVLLCVPIVGNSGSRYGMCGIELNALHFQLEYPAVESEFGSMITVIAPVVDGKLRVDRGMVGSTQGTWLNGTEQLDIVRGSGYSSYNGEENSFLGVQRELDIPGEDGTKWVVALLAPKERCVSYISDSKLHRFTGIAIFILCMFLLVVYLSRKFVKPILDSFEAIMEERYSETQGIRITEMEELKAFLAGKTENSKNGDVPKHIEEMLNIFKSRTETLTPAERMLLTYYANGYAMEEVAERMFISVNTVKKHNTNLNHKLEISSKSELMVYIDLFRRCGRVDELLMEIEQVPDRETDQKNT